MFCWVILIVIQRGFKMFKASISKKFNSTNWNDGGVAPVQQDKRSEKEQIFFQNGHFQ